MSSDAAVATTYRGSRHLVAEAAPDVRADDPDLVGQAGDDREQRAVDVRGCDVM